MRTDAEPLWGEFQHIIANNTKRDNEIEELFDLLRSYLAPGEILYSQKRLFSYERTVKNGDDITEARQFINDLYKNQGIDAVVDFAKYVEDLSFLSSIVYQIFDSKDYYGLIEKLEKNRRFQCHLVENISSEELVTYVKGNVSERLILLTEHSITNEIIEYIECMKAPDKKYYWKKVYIGKCVDLSDRYFDLIIKELQRYGRITESIYLIENRVDRNRIKTELIFKTLERFDLEGLEINLKANHTLCYSIKKLILYLHNNELKKIDRIADIEAKYIQLLVPYSDIKPKYIYYKMANAPECIFRPIGKLIPLETG